MRQCGVVARRRTTCAWEIRAPWSAVQSRRFSVLEYARKGASLQSGAQERWSRLPDGIVALAVHAQCYSGAHPTAVFARDPIVCISNLVPSAVHDPVNGGTAARTPTASWRERRGTRTVFTTHTFRGVGVASPQLPRHCRACRRVVTGLGVVELRMFASEGAMLRAWQHFVVHEVDPDILCGFDLAGYVQSSPALVKCPHSLLRRPARRCGSYRPGAPPQASALCV